MSVVLIGAGPHSTTVWLPQLAELERSGLVRLVAVVDISEQALAKVARKHPRAATLRVEPLAATNQLPASTHARLAGLRLAGQVLVIIATEPTSHAAYAAWAMTSGFHVLLDKPISARAHAITDSRAARGHEQDWQLLVDLRRGRPDQLLIVNAHRRFERPYLFLAERLAEVATAYAAAVTHVTVHHTDGQFRTRSELANETYHGFDRGIGKITHSAFHFGDLIGWLYATTPIDQRADRMDVDADLVTVEDHLASTGDELRQRLLGEVDPTDYSFRGYGEVDANAQIRLHRGQHRVAGMQLHLAHSGLSQRGQLAAAEDLYRSNGRIRHVYVAVELTPVMRVELESTQVYEPSEASPLDVLELGGRDHIEIRLFRNQALGTSRIERWDAHDLGLTRGTGPAHDDVKGAVLRRVIGAVRDPVSASTDQALRFGDIAQYGFPVHLTAALYLSHQRRASGQSPTVSAPLALPTELPPPSGLGHHSPAA